MASKKDMKRSDLIIPYVEPDLEGKPSDISSTISSSVPMAAIYTRQKMIGWVGVVFSLQNWLQEPPDRTAVAPGYFSVVMALLSLVICYMPLFMPPPPNAQSQTGAPPPAPPPH